MAPKKGGSGKVKSKAEFEARFADRRVDPKELSRVQGYYPTGSIRLDRRLGGGLPMGKMTEIYGPPGGGKTTLALSIMGIALDAGLRCAYKDLERGLDLQSEGMLDEEGFVDADALRNATDGDVKERVTKRESWLRRNGVDPSHEKFHIYDPINGEELFEMLGAEVEHDIYDIIVVDSIPAIMPRSVLEGMPGDATYGARAKLLAEEMPRLLALYRGNPKATIIFINQVRENIGAQVKSQKATGGFALDHFVRTKIKIQRIGRKEQGDDVLTESICKLEKNIAGAYATESIFISAKRGVDTLSELLETGADFGYIHISGSWHYFFAEPVEATAFAAAQKSKKIAELSGFLTGKNGQAGALEWMHENGWKEKLYPLAMKAA